MRGVRLGAGLVAMLAVMACSVAVADVPERTDPDGSRFAGERSEGVSLTAIGSGRGSGEADRERLDKKRRSPENKRARQRARKAFAKQDRAKALKTMKDAFPDLTNAPPWKPLKLGDGDQLMGYLGPNTAKVKAKKGGVQIVDSQLPLRARPRDGGPIEPVSFDMLAGATSFRPANPLVETIINKDLDEGIAFPEQDFAIRPTGASSTDEPMRVGDKVLFTNLVTDTDLFVIPTPTGAETVLQVRSADAPDRSALQLMLGAGQTVRPVGQGGGGEGAPGSMPGPASPAAFEIVGADGTPVAQIPAPNGVDAAGRTVAVSMSLEGPDKLVLSYPHDDPDLEFPLAIDPIIDAYGIDPYSGSRVNDYDPFSYWDYWGNDYYNANIRKNPYAAGDPNFSVSISSAVRTSSVTASTSTPTGRTPITGTTPSVSGSGPRPAARSSAAPTSAT